MPQWLCDKGLSFNAIIEQNGLPDDVAELSYRLMRHFFPEQLRFTAGRDGWQTVFEVAMRPNPMGVTGVVLCNPCGTDCIAFAQKLLATRLFG